MQAKPNLTSFLRLSSQVLRVVCLFALGGTACSLSGPQEKSAVAELGRTREGRTETDSTFWDNLKLTSPAREDDGTEFSGNFRSGKWNLLQPQTSEPEGPAFAIGKGPVSLGSCMEAALRRNIDTRIRVIEAKGAEAGVDRAKAEFDPVLTTQVSNGLWGLRDTSHVGAQLGKRFTSGTELFVETGSRTEDSLRIDERLSPGDSSDLGFRIRQPLLRGAGADYNRVGVERAKLIADAADQTVVGQVLLTLRLTETTYWTATVAKYNVAIQQSGVERTRLILEDVQQRRDLGTASRLDTLEAEAALARATESLVRAKKQHEDEVANLRFLLDLPLGEETRHWSFDNVTREFDKKTAPDPAKTFKNALEKSPEAVILANEVQQRRVELFRARGDLKPRLDFEVDARTAGQYARSQGEEWEALASLRFSMPWGRREQKADFAEAQARLDASGLGREQGLRRLELQIHETVRRIRSGRDELAAASHGLTVQQAKWEEQKQQHKEGLTSTRQLMEAEGELRAAEINETEARLRLITAWSILTQLEGSIAERHGIEFSETNLSAVTASTQ